MSPLCALIDLQGAPTSAVILRSMSGAAADASKSHQLLTGPAGFSCRSPGHQIPGPELVSDSEAQLAVAADARLDNRRELRDQLQETLRGDRPPTDAELILAAYRTWGHEAPARLLGDFAFVLWDGRARRLLAARDPLGIRRLLYARVGSRLCIATEVEQILRHPAISRELDESSLLSYLCGLPDDPARTFFRHVKSLPPGHRLLVEDTRVSIDRFWDIDPAHQIRYRDSGQYAEHLRETLRTAVSDRLPETAGSVVGISMSGGLDSCSVAALAHGQLEAGPGKRSLAAASLVFDQLPSCDERPYIAEMARSFGFPTDTVVADQFGFLDGPARHPDLDSPFMAWESANQELLQSLRRRGARHLLTGHGGDELLAGSPLSYHDRFYRGDWTAVGEIVRYARGRNESALGPLYRCFVAPGIGSGLDHRLRRLLGKSTAPEIPGWIGRDLRRRSAIDLRLLEPPTPARFREKSRQAIYDSLVVRGDHLRSTAWFDSRAAAAGLEARHPFLDRRLVELVLALPPEELFRAEVGKPLLRKAMAGILPEKVRCRQDKTQLGPFVDQRLKENEQANIEHLLEKPMLAELGLVDPRALRKTYEHYRRSRPTDALRTIWYAITLESWLLEHATFLQVDRPAQGMQSLVA